MIGEPAYFTRRSPLVVALVENKRQYFKALTRLFGGEGGIRTPDTVARMPHFECGAFDHSATSPRGAPGDVSERSIINTKVMFIRLGVPFDSDVGVGSRGA